MADLRAEDGGHVNCPQCGTKVADGEAICPKCDYILDASFLGSGAPPEADDVAEKVTDDNKTGISRAEDIKPRPSGSRPSVKNATGARPAVNKTGSTAARPAVKNATGARSAVNKTGAAAARPAQKSTASAAVRRSATVSERPPNAQEPETESTAEVVPPRGGGPPPRAYTEDARPPTNDNLRHNSGITMVPPEQALDDFKGFVQNLPGGDKLAFVGASLTVLSCFLPWKDTAADGEILGLMSLGLISFLVNIAIIASIVIRVRRVMPALNPLVPWLVQLGGAFFSGIWCLVYMGISTDLRKTQALIGNFEVSVSKPAIGVYLAVVFTVCTVVGSLMGLRAKS